MENTQTIVEPYHQPTKERRLQHRNHTKRISPATFWVIIGAFLVLLPILLGSAVMIYFQVKQLNLPGVIVYDTPFGLANYQKTAAQIDSNWNKTRRINLVSDADPAISYWFSPAELGLWVDPQGTADTAYSVGRGVQPFKDILSSLRGEPHVVYPILYFDETIARNTLSAIDEELTIHAQDARVIFQDDEWIALPGSEGRSVDIDATIKNLNENPFDILLNGSIPIKIMPQAPAIVDLSPVVAEIETVISQEYNLTAYDPIENETFIWSVPIEMKRTWVSVNPDDHSVNMTYQENDITNMLNTWQAELGDERSFLNLNPEKIIEDWEKGETADLMVQHDPTTYQVTSGESLWSISLKLGMPMYHIMEANEGLTTNNIQAGMVLDIPSRDILLPLPVVQNKRIVIDISEQRMTVYEDGDVRNTYIVSTGVSDSPTMAGVFQVQTHELNAYASNWDLYMPHFMGIYEAWPGFMNGIHGLPLLSGGGRLWASTLGSPASYGCIILDLGAAEDLYNWADPGVVVEIRR